MDQCEDREEGVPPSKSTLCGEHESQTKAQRKKRRRRKRKPETETEPGPPPSSVSLQSDESKGDGRPPAKRSKMEASVKEQLLGMLDDLRKKELKRFHWYLQNGPGGDFRTIKKSRLEKASRTRTVDLMVGTYTTDHVMEVARLILKKIKKRNSLSLITSIRIRRLSSCNVSEEGCENLLSVVSSQSCSLRELDLSTNSLKASAVKLLSAAVESPHAKLNILRLNICELSEENCEALSSVLSSQSSSLTELDLSIRKLQDSGVKLLSAGLQSLNCKLNTLRSDQIF
ncbi:NACHT, LRR and PYD domains-containing protein 1b allele 4-like [Oreochromis aureus]|uniref:NACHT, LRR and PYD domains-containing protein 1b allele 4-like n=1 Tax=Oreochromis aureus TaxID=47969 RepID=UPI001954D026|nr:NACHT, LRR and PYD domains-containing protein 1b allele 4-like [Oreochromis aureus]